LLVLKLSGGLGNNLFQYASVSAVALRSNSTFVHLPHRDAGFVRRVSRFISTSCKRNKPPLKQTAKEDITNFFVLKHDPYLKRAIKKAFFYISNFITPWQIFRPHMRSIESGDKFEVFDRSAFSLSGNTLCIGGYQSAAYFKGYEKEVHSWFQLKPRYKKKYDSIVESMSGSSELRCCIHVRAGDYLNQDKGIGRGEGVGWSLASNYYEMALNHLVGVAGLQLFLMTDDLDFCYRHLPGLKQATPVQSGIDAIDLKLMGEFKYLVTANSSFSWWGAWLNRIDGKVVIAPKFHLGREVNRWLPFAMENEFPKDWIYL